MKKGKYRSSNRDVRNRYIYSSSARNGQIPIHCLGFRPFRRCSRQADNGIFFTIIFLFFTSFPAWSQTENTLTPDKLREDFEQLLAVIDAHPDPFTHVDESEFKAHVERVRSSLDKPHTTLEFYRKAASVTALIRDGHSSVRLPEPWLRQHRKDYGAFPYRLHLTNDDELYVIKRYREDGVPEGAKIISINAITVDSFLRKVDPYIAYERKPFRNTLIDNNFEQYLYLAFGQSTNTELEYFATDTLKAMVESISLKEWNSFQKDDREERESKIMRGEPYAYEKIAEGIGLIHIYSFAVGDLSAYEFFLRKTFRTIKQDQVHSLIIDIRGNYGGWPKSSSYLFHYISDNYFKTMARSRMKVSNAYRENVYARSPLLRKYERSIKLSKRNHYVDMKSVLRGKLDTYVEEEVFFNEEPEEKDFEFTGDCYLLTNRDSYSAASSFASTFQCYQMGIIIGEETGGTKIFRANAIWETLKNSGLRVGMSTTQMFTACYHQEHQGVLPNIEYVPSIFELISEVDTQLMYTLRVIKKAQQLKAAEMERR